MKIPFILSFLLMTAPLWAAPGHDHGFAPGEEAAEGQSGIVTLTETARQNLGLTVVEASIENLGPGMDLPAVLSLPPERQATVTAPFVGRIAELLVRQGDRVKKDQPLLRVSPLAAGSPAQEIRSPIEGLVLRINSVVGSTFQPETELLNLGDPTELMAEGVVYQSPELAKVRQGQAARVRVDVLPGETFPTVIESLSPSREPSEPMFLALGRIKNKDGKLLPNYRARMFVEIGEAQPVVAIPRKAVLGSEGGRFVFIETEPGTYERRDVVTGIQSGGLVEIIEGVLPGEKVVTVGNYQLQYAMPAGEAAGGGDDHGHSHGH